MDRFPPFDRLHAVSALDLEGPVAEALVELLLFEPCGVLTRIGTELVRRQGGDHLRAKLIEVLRDAAETLRAQGQGEQAIASLVSAAFFQAARYGVPPEMVEAAAALYRELGAESHEQALMAGLRQQLPE